MTLTVKLNEIRKAAKQRIPREVLEIMERATRELRESGIMEKALSVGDSFPASMVNLRGHYRCPRAML